MTDDVKDQAADTSAEAPVSTATAPVVPPNDDPMLDTRSADDMEFLKQIPEEFQAEPSIKNIRNLHGLVKGYVHAQKELGGRIKIPAKDADPRIRQEFFNKLQEVEGVMSVPAVDDPEFEKKMGSIYDKLGRPKSPDEYKLEAKDGLKLDDDAAKAIKEAAYKAGVSQSQLSALSAIEEAQAQKMVAALKEHQSNVKKYFQEKWGKDYDSNLKVAQGTLFKFAQVYPEAVQELRTGIAGTNPVVIEAMLELGKLHREETTMAANDTSPKTELTVKEISDKISSIRMDKNDPFNIANHPNHAARVDEVKALYQQRSEKEQGNS